MVGGRVPVQVDCFADREFFFITKDGSFVKLIELKVDNKREKFNKMVGYFEGNIDDDVRNFNLKNKKIITGSEKTCLNSVSQQNFQWYHSQYLNICRLE